MPRVLLPLLALLLLAASVTTLLWSDRGGGSLITYLRGNEETPEQRAARVKARHDADMDYVRRVRADGVARVFAGDYENGRTRLDEAARIDPEGEKSKDVVTARHWIELAPVVSSADWP